MSEPLLFHDGKAYQISAETAADLLARGVIVRDGPDYGMSLEHEFDEIESLVALVPQSNDEKPSLNPLGHRGLRWFWVLNPRGDARQSLLSRLYRDTKDGDDPRQR